MGKKKYYNYPNRELLTDDVAALIRLRMKYILDLLESQQDYNRVAVNIKNCAEAIIDLAGEWLEAKDADKHG